VVKTYNEAVQFLESLQIMPKTMPGLDKIKRALVKTGWYAQIDPKKVVIVAGTNGKGTTSAALEALLLHAGQRVGFYSSPHLISTTERIRLNGQDISEFEFLDLFHRCENLIKECELSHFEALSLMAGEYFFGSCQKIPIDFAIFEVGLGGTYDATNAFPHKYVMVTKLGLDHISILGSTIQDIAMNKFGVVTKKSIVVHHVLPAEVMELKSRVQKETNSNWVETEKADLTIDSTGPRPRFYLKHNDIGMKFEINIPGPRAAENIMTAATLFQILGFDLSHHVLALKQIQWRGRMQEVKLPEIKCPVFLSGDHNLQGVESLIEVLKGYKFSRLHLVVGIGVDKQADEMFQLFETISNVQFYLTKTPFKGRSLNEYPQRIKQKALGQTENIHEILKMVSEKAEVEDLCVVTGSLYLVGEVLKTIPT
jgi:dihydrofolate synthase / folylpolyglutamate synthase